MYKHTLKNRVSAIGRAIQNTVLQDPLNITLELTRRCNAKCDYCNHWKEQRQTEQEIADFEAIVRRFNPFSVTICGGEPFMRRDTLDVIRAVKSLPGWR